MSLLCEYGIRAFWELGIRRIPWNTWNTGGIRQNTGLWEVIWNTWKTYSCSDTDVQMYLFETFGGWCNAVKRLFYQMKDKVRNKLSKRQHEDEASWSTRSLLSLQAKRTSVARCSSRRRKRLRPSSGSPRRRTEDAAVA